MTILKQFPRVEMYGRPDIRTTGKALEFLFSKARTEWIMITDSDLTFPQGWYDEMCKYRDRYDAFDSKRIHAYEFFREDLATMKLEVRPLVNSPQMARLRTLKDFRVDDDYLWRITDIATRQTIEKAGYRYGKVVTAFHYHHTTEEAKYASDPTKIATKMVFEEPREVVVNRENWHRRLIQNAKAYVKYTDPNMPYVAHDTAIDDILLPLLERSWVREQGPAWLARYDRAVSLRSKLRRRMRKLKRLVLRLLQVALATKPSLLLI